LNWKLGGPQPSLDTLEKIKSLTLLGIEQFFVCPSHSLVPTLSQLQPPCVIEYKMKHGNKCFVGEKEKEPVISNRIHFF
jgi:hypothetical protein